LAQQSCPIHRQGRADPVDLRPLIEELAIVDGVLRFRLKIPRQSSVRPREVLETLGIVDLYDDGVCLTRTSVELETN
jgi:hypothetical protein